jgi:hypothetical protein
MNVFQKIDMMKLSGLILFILIAMLITCSGCIKGGRTVSANTTGRVITSSELIRQPNGVYKLKPAKIEPVKSKPVPVEPKSAPANPVRVQPKPAAIKPAPFKPTVKEAKLSPAEILIEDLKNVGKENNTNTGSSTTIDKQEIADPHEGEPKMKVNWMELIKFYLIAFGFIFFMYWGWKLARKKTQDMIIEERKQKNLKKPAKKRPMKRASKKKAVKKGK